MKRILLIAILAVSFLIPSFTCSAREVKIKGPQGNISAKITLPEGFDKEKDSCPMVILMHGIFSSKSYNPMPSLAKALASEGIASIRFDFDGHGKSDGRMQDMTVEKEISDAMAIYSFVEGLPWVDAIGLLGHSQGGVIASMTAGRLSESGKAPSGLVLLAPGTVIKEATASGKFFNAKFDPKDPPEFVRCWGVMKLGRDYLLSTQNLDIYGESSPYGGKVLLLHGTKDKIVPLWCSEKYLDTYGDNATLQLIEGENHTITKKTKEVCRMAAEFFKGIFFP